MTSSKKITITLPDRTLETEPGTLVYEILPRKQNDKEIVGVLLNGHLVSLNTKIYTSIKLEPVTADSSFGSMIVRRTATLLFHALCKKHYPQIRIEIGQSLLGGYFYAIEGYDSDITKLASELNELYQEATSQALPIKKRIFSIEQVRHLFKERNCRQLDLLKVWQSPFIPVAQCLEFVDIRHGPYAQDTSCAKDVFIESYDRGLLLIFDPDHPTRKADQGRTEVLFQAYSETRSWNEKVGVKSIVDINNYILNDSIDEVIRIAEGLHEKKVAVIADDISDRPESRIVCVAGPSSAGKTTFVKRLTTQLRVNGITPVTLSLDNYYVNRTETPKDESGEYDFEAIEAIDLEFLQDNLIQLIEGKAVSTPKFDFKTGMRVPKDKWREIQLRDNQVLLIEGIHGLNPKLTASVPESQKYRIFINALTQLCIDDHNRIRTSDTRLLRRIVRDRRYRNYSCEDTIKRWPLVRAGEDKHIYPFQGACDVMFNSALVYEFSVLKLFALRYLLEVPQDSLAKPVAHQLLSFLELIVPTLPDAIPSTSILREFLGGSEFSY